MINDSIDGKLISVFPGKIVRKELLLRIKSGTNIPTFVLEFLLARYCASDDPNEIQEGLEAVKATLMDNYVRPDEANAAQSKVATKGRHRFIDKVHVSYIEKEKRHWAALENFNSQRVAISDRYYRDNERLLEGGIWAEVTVSLNEVQDDDYTFQIDDLRPIQLSRFDFDGYAAARRQFSRDEWMDVILRSVGLEPSKLSKRLKFHFIARLASLVEPNYNFIELGPRGTGKSYFFSEFSPYSTLISGGQASMSVLFYNLAKRKPGLVVYWNNIAFDEVADVKIKDPNAITVMKDFMANGRFSRGVEVIGSASLSFVGNIDYSVPQVVNSPNHDLFLSLPKELDFAIQDRFACYLPGWEMPKTDSKFLTKNYGLITDYLAEAFHYEFVHTNRYDEVKKRVRLGDAIQGRDEKCVIKTICAFLKILHPDGAPSDTDFEEYVEYALEARRRVKEQMNKRKPDEEFARIDFSYINTKGQEIFVTCPESKNSEVTQHPIRKQLNQEKIQVAPPKHKIVEHHENKEPMTVSALPDEPKVTPEDIQVTDSPSSENKVNLCEKHFTIMYGETGNSYEKVVGPYLEGASEIHVDEPYLRYGYQQEYFLRFCEMLVKNSNIHKITLATGYDDETQKGEIAAKLDELKQSLLDIDIVFSYSFNTNLHDRDIYLNTGWHIKIGRGLHFYQKPAGKFAIGVGDLSLRPCLETKVDIFKG